MKTKEIIILLLTTFLLSFCSSSQQTTDQDNSSKDSSEVYVFDNIDASESDNNEEPDENTSNVLKDSAQANTTVQFFIVQVGAFTTEERAKRFIDENKGKIDKELNTHFSDSVNLYVVQLPPFRNRMEAEEVRNHLWTIPEFKDSFIVPK